MIHFRSTLPSCSALLAAVDSLQQNENEPPSPAESLSSVYSIPITLTKSNGPPAFANENSSVRLTPPSENIALAERKTGELIPAHPGDMALPLYVTSSKKSNPRPQKPSAFLCPATSASFEIRDTVPSCQKPTKIATTPSLPVTPPLLASTASTTSTTTEHESTALTSTKDTRALLSTNETTQSLLFHHHLLPSDGQSRYSTSNRSGAMQLTTISFGSVTTHGIRRGSSNFGPRPYACPIRHCSSVFSRRYNLLAHFRKHAHQLGATKEAIEKGCDALKNCPVAFTPAAVAFSDTIK